MVRLSRWSHAIELTLFLCHTPASEGVAEHSSRLQPSINLHAPVTALMFCCSGIDVLPRRDEGSVVVVVVVVVVVFTLVT